jgi:hypothetical protein
MIDAHAIPLAAVPAAVARRADTAKTAQTADAVA